jgi:hypothetical protein
MSRGRLLDCPVEGCTQRSPARALRRHQRATHIRCSCGWVGVSFTQHRAQRIRFRGESAPPGRRDVEMAAERLAHRATARIVTRARTA